MQPPKLTKTEEEHFIYTHTQLNIENIHENHIYYIVIGVAAHTNSGFFVLFVSVVVFVYYDSLCKLKLVVFAFCAFKTISQDYFWYNWIRSFFRVIYHCIVLTFILDVSVKDWKKKPLYLLFFDDFCVEIKIILIDSNWKKVALMQKFICKCVFCLFLMYFWNDHHKFFC